MKKATSEPTQAEQQTPAPQNLPMQLDVRIKSIRPEGNIKAFASMNINGCFAVDGIKVMDGEKGKFVVMPSYKDGQGKYHEVAFPIEKQFRTQLHAAVLDAYQQVLTQAQSNTQAPQEPEQEQTGPAMSMA